jgi:hypothetical protein
MVGWGAALVVSRTGTAVLLAEGREKKKHVWTSVNWCVCRPCATDNVLLHAASSH